MFNFSNVKNFLKSYNISPSIILSNFKKTFFIFSDVKVLNNFLFNLFGIQIFRILISNFIINLKRKIFFSKKRFEYEKKFLVNNGYLILENFLNKSDFEKLKLKFSEKIKKSHNIYEKYDFKNSVYKYNIEKNNLDDNLKKVLFQSKLVEILSFAEGRYVDYNSNESGIWFESIENCDDKKNKEVDPQTILHRDTFYSSYKMIFYINDVNEKNGAFIYSVKSNKKNMRKLICEYINSISLKPSLNIRGDKNIFLKYYENNEINLSAKANTLILADVSGFHKRGLSEGRAIRNTFRFSNRFHPFNMKIKSN